MALSTTKTVKIFLVMLAFIVFVDIVRQSSILNTNSNVSLQNTKDTDFPFKKIRSVQYSTAIIYSILLLRSPGRSNSTYISLLLLLLLLFRSMKLWNAVHIMSSIGRIA